MSKKILIADDEPNIVISLEYLMQREGHEVLVARDGEEALAMIREHAPDLVLLDAMMPKLTGFEVLQQLREDGLELKVLMLTAKGRDTDIEKGRALGADDYVVKPFSTRELVERVKLLLELEVMRSWSGAS
jgi:DNA-binding response OmpR family regulator